MRVFRVLTVATWALLSMGCPKTEPTNDGGEIDFDAGNPPARDACSGGCADNQFCDTARRTCVSGCTGGCDAGVCTRVGPDTFRCVITPVTTCGPTPCEPGQVACLSGQCTCLASAQGAGDTCVAQGQWCENRICRNPKRLEECQIGGPACPAGHACTDVFGDLPICTKSCQSNQECDRGELCSGSGCLASALFTNQECAQNVLTDGGFEIVLTDGGTRALPDGGSEAVLLDGGLRRITVPAGNTCLLKDQSGNITDPPGVGTGNCGYARFKFADEGLFLFSTCRPPGTALEGQPCREDYSQGAIGTQCSTGLQCALTSGGQDGVCLRMCNANPPKFGIFPKPACGADEACVNTSRYTDPNDNSVLGVCMKNCNVFDAATATCANVGVTPTSCVPATPDGEFLVSARGAGICVPQQTLIASAQQPCNETDPFRGAACASGQVCTSLNPDDPSTCVTLCDTTCNPTDSSTAPARCATQPNARCTTGTCRRASSTTGSTVGFCR
ncbi:MAG: hypothetical protein JNG84_07360 [Archangium sp.]|nr:hypothetical protein [Archangium sp.]